MHPCAGTLKSYSLILYHYFICVRDNKIRQMCQTVWIINPVRLTAKRICSKSSFVVEAAFRMRSFHSDLCGGCTATMNERPQQLFCLQKSKTAAANVRIEVFGRINVATAGELLLVGNFYEGCCKNDRTFAINCTQTRWTENNINF